MRSIEHKILSRIERDEKRRAELAHMRAVVNFNSNSAFEGWYSWDMDNKSDVMSIIMDERY